MKLFKIAVLLSIIVVISCASGNIELPPNIVLIVADDMGWDDVSFHGSNQILTPNIDVLALSGIALGRYYSHSICTPSRSALMTGKYAHRIGMQGYPLTNSEDRGLPITEKLLPQYLKELGYRTHLVGKWHIGNCRSEYLPTARGFDSHFGHRGGYIDYYEFLLEEEWTSGKAAGFDLYRNNTAAWDVEGYLTDIYNNEANSIIMQHDKSNPLFLMVAHNAPHSANAGTLLQAPPEIVRQMRHVESPDRRIYAAMVKKLDDSVGDIVESLSKKGMLNNTVIVFVSDNGGMTSGQSTNYASNWPLRGLKFSPFEGGVRVVGLIWSSSLNNSHHLWNGYMHVTDWVPTLLSIAGSSAPSDINGIDQWKNIISNNNSNRDEIFEIDDYDDYASIISGDYKLLNGNVYSEYSDHQGGNLRGTIGNGPSYMDAVKNCKTYQTLDTHMEKPFNIENINLIDDIRINCEIGVNKQDLCYPQNGKVCLYNIKDDPCETTDLAHLYPELVKNMTDKLILEMSKMIPRIIPLYRDPRSAPRLFNYTWDTWANKI